VQVVETLTRSNPSGWRRRAGFSNHTAGAGWSSAAGSGCPPRTSLPGGTGHRPPNCPRSKSALSARGVRFGPTSFTRLRPMNFIDRIISCKYFSPPHPVRRRDALRHRVRRLRETLRQYALHVPRLCPLALGLRGQHLDLLTAPLRRCRSPLSAVALSGQGRHGVVEGFWAHHRTFGKYLRNPFHTSELGDPRFGPGGAQGEDQRLSRTTSKDQNHTLNFMARV
jgi:hypothetical protein